MQYLLIEVEHYIKVTSHILRSENEIARLRRHFQNIIIYRAIHSIESLILAVLSRLPAVEKSQVNLCAQSNLRSNKVLNTDSTNKTDCMIYIS